MTPGEHVTVFLLRLIAAAVRKKYYARRVDAGCGCPTCVKERPAGFIWYAEQGVEQ